MDFALSPDHAAVQERARSVAAAVRGHAAEIDRTGAVPLETAHEAAGGTDEPLEIVLWTEEIASASAAVALTAASLKRGTETMALSGLRGARTLENTPRSQLVLAAAALGIGRSAIEAALAEVREATATPGADVEKPHWVVADAATELEAARLLTYKAARTMSDADIALARLMATGAADRAVGAALRVIGPEALKEGSVLERLSRDVRTIALVLGTEEHQRAVAADGLFPL
jgi:hypothetical protein